MTPLPLTITYAFIIGPEAFLTLRTEFAKTLGVSSAFGYILGLGDRHLDNLLMDEQSGAIVQIDFGMTFGIGASMLPVPELIPCRVSPQVSHPINTPYHPTIVG